MKTYTQILMKLPEEFTRTEFMNMISEETAFSYDYAQKILDGAIQDEWIRRVDRCVYKKCEPEFEFETK